MNVVPNDPLHASVGHPQSCTSGIVSASLSFYLPETRVRNEDLEAILPDFSADMIARKIGILERRVVSDGETAVDLAEQAAILTLQHSDRDSIDFLILCTQSPDYFLPASACILQHRLGLPSSVGALDINQGCSGFVYGLQLAKGLLASGECRTVLFVTADAYSRYLATTDTANRSIFGDGAAACLIRAGGGDLLMHRFVMGTDGGGHGNLVVSRGAFRNPGIPEGDSFPLLFMNGPEIFHFALDVVPRLVNEILRVNEVRMEDVDLFVFHQANKYMLEHLRRKLRIEPERFHVSMEWYGNTVSSTIPIALAELKASNRILPGMTLMLVGFGVGYSWGGTLLTVKTE